MKGFPMKDRDYVDMSEEERDILIEKIRRFFVRNLPKHAKIMFFLIEEVEQGVGQVDMETTSKAHPLMLVKIMRDIADEEEKSYLELN